MDFYENYLYADDSAPFVANDGGRWFVMQNEDTEDSQGYRGMRTHYRCSTDGYDTREEAWVAMTKECA